jgi:hypothetical protein
MHMGMYTAIGDTWGAGMEEGDPLLGEGRHG